MIPWCVEQQLPCIPGYRTRPLPCSRRSGTDSAILTRDLKSVRRLRRTCDCRSSVSLRPRSNVSVPCWDATSLIGATCNRRLPETFPVPFPFLTHRFVCPLPTCFIKVEDPLIEGAVTLPDHVPATLEETSPATSHSSVPKPVTIVTAKICNGARWFEGCLVSLRSPTLASQFTLFSAPAIEPPAGMPALPAFRGSEGGSQLK